MLDKFLLIMTFLYKFLQVHIPEHKNQVIKNMIPGSFWVFFIHKEKSKKVTKWKSVREAGEATK